MNTGSMHAIAVGDGRLILKRGVKELLVSGEDAQAVADAVLSGLETGASVADVLAVVPAERQGAVIDLLRALAARQMLAGGGASSPEASFFENFGDEALGAGDALAAAYVVVDGSGAVASALRQALADVGVGSVSEVGADDAGANLVIATSDTGDETALLRASREALRRGTRFLPAWLDAMTGYVGPLTHPFDTACLRCYQLRVDANDSDREARRAIRRRAAEDPSVNAAAGLLKPMASVLGQIAAMEAAKELGGFAPVDAVGRSIEINLVSFRSTIRRVLKLPRCPDCGEPARHSTRTVFSGIQIAE
jgi:bacteriocin biosynthesis cyclodehydratase domain-containing protein